jgi:Pectate lyase superfamily protein/Right handed beta helix region
MHPFPSLCASLICASAAALLLGPFAAGHAHAATPDACSVTPASPLVVNVRQKGAKGDGRTDDTRAIQTAIDAVAGTGGTVYVPDGIYMVRGVGKDGLTLKSRMSFKLADHAVLKVIPNGAPVYAVLTIADASDVKVVGGTLEGDRKAHRGKTGEWGMGLRIGDKAARVTVAGVTAKEMWGDGFYIGGGDNVALCGVEAIHNRRQGLSIVDGRNILVTQSEFRETAGTAPSGGIDIEPDLKNSVEGVDIERSKFIDNAGGGIRILANKGDVSDVSISYNVFEGNRPLLVRSAPHIRSSQICNNRYIYQQTPPSQEFNASAEPVDIVVVQADCRKGRDMRFETERKKK